MKNAMKILFVKLSILFVPSIAFAHGVSESDKSEMPEKSEENHRGVGQLREKCRDVC